MMEKLKVHTVLSVLTLVIGVVLLSYMVYAESEPGAIPLLLVVSGMGWFFITRLRVWTHQR